MSEQKIQGGRYLLSLQELAPEAAGAFAAASSGTAKEDGTLAGRILGALDRERRKKASRLKGMPRLQSMGAGLLLQLAARDWERGSRIPLSPLSVTEVLSLLDGYAPREMEYCYGSKGKPYAVSPNFSFSLSHSASCVFCAVSDREIGADIQVVRGGKNLRRIADRFFTEEEKAYLEACPDSVREAAFYRLWARKEAYGKWTGEGVVSALGAGLVPEDGQETGFPSGISVQTVLSKPLCWEERSFSLGGETYFLSVCSGAESS